MDQKSDTPEQAGLSVRFDMKTRQKRNTNLFVMMNSSISRHKPSSGYSTPMRQTICFSLLIVAVLSLCSPVSAQYDGGYQQHESGDYSGGGGGYEYGMDERPKLNLGIRLRIPAFKFELPRFSLPKITVSAKIRQPDRPRVINLPEINLDTTSKVEPPGSKMGNMHGGGGGGGGGKSYGGGNSYGGTEYKTSSSNYHEPNMSYGPQREKSQTFTFSTHEDTHPSSHGGGNYQWQNNYGNMRPMASPMQYNRQNNQYGMRQQQQHYGGGGGGGYHSATMSQPMYMVYNQPPVGNYQAQTNYNTALPNNQEPLPSKNPDLGFNSPVYVNPKEETEPSSHSRIP